MMNNYQQPFHFAEYSLYSPKVVVIVKLTYQLALLTCLINLSINLLSNWLLSYLFALLTISICYNMSIC